ncbi:MAG: OsmC family protein [Acidimicrobiales bacterium]|jgi:putative redox protein
MATVTAELTAGFNVNISNGRHEWSADEPESLGGTDTGLNPYEFLLGALASCASITVAMYARRKKMAFDSISVRYHYDRVHSEDCAECENDAAGFIDRVTSEIFIEESDRERLALVARRCPVHKTLANGIHFEEEVTVG